MQDETATPMMVRADELTAGDIIRYGGDDLQVYSEPEYLIRGMVFDALPLGLEATGETQQMCLHPQLRVQLLDHQKPIAASPAIEALILFSPIRSDDKMNPLNTELDPHKRLAILQEQWDTGNRQTQWEIAIALAEHPDWGIDVMPAWSAGKDRRGTIVGTQGRSKANIQWYQGRPEEQGTVGTVAFSQLKLVQRSDQS